MVEMEIIEGNDIYTMKRIATRFFLAAVLASAVFNVFSCQKPQPVVPDEPDDEFVSDADTILIDGEYPVPHPEIPMKIYDRECVVSDAGVSVEAFDITENNFKSIDFH